MKITEIPLNPGCVRCGALNVMYYVIGEGEICQACWDRAEAKEADDCDSGEEGQL